MSRQITAGIDLGTYATRVVVCERSGKDGTQKVIATGYYPTRGVRHGYITNISEAAQSVRKAIYEAEQNAKIKIKRVFVSIGGISLSSEVTTGSAVPSKATGEITSLDIHKAMEEAEESVNTTNRKILEAIPIEYKLDGKEIPGRPEGMRGIKLEIKVIFITCLSQHLEDLVTTFAEAGVDIIDVIPSPLAASVIALSERQKTAGSVLINIGSETVSMVVFENSKVISLDVFAIGSVDITNDIALGLKISLDEAEAIKTSTVIHNHPKKKLDEIMEARLSDIFELVENHLKKIKRNGLLPAGAILIGGGSDLPQAEEVAKELLKLPTKVGISEDSYFFKQKFRDTSWFVALGLCYLEKGMFYHEPKEGIFKIFSDIKIFFKSILKQLQP